MVQMCRFVRRGCREGARCQFAHSAEELRTPRLIRERRTAAALDERRTTQERRIAQERASRASLANATIARLRNSPYLDEFCGIYLSGGRDLQTCVQWLHLRDPTLAGMIAATGTDCAAMIDDDLAARERQADAARARQEQAREREAAAARAREQREREAEAAAQEAQRREKEREKERKIELKIIKSADGAAKLLRAPFGCGTRVMAVESRAEELYLKHRQISRPQQFAAWLATQPGRRMSIKDMKAAIEDAGLDTEDLIERADIEERYARASARNKRTLVSGVISAIEAYEFDGEAGRGLAAWLDTTAEDAFATTASPAMKRTLGPFRLCGGNDARGELDVDAAAARCDLRFAISAPLTMESAKLSLGGWVDVLLTPLLDGTDGPAPSFGPGTFAGIEVRGDEFDPVVGRGTVWCRAGRVWYLERRGEGLFAGCNIPPQPGSPGTEHAKSVAVPISRLRHVTPVARGHLEQYFGATDPTSLPGTTSRPLAEWERASDAELWRASELWRLTDWNQAFVAGQEPFSALPEALRECNFDEMAPALRESFLGDPACASDRLVAACLAKLAETFETYDRHGENIKKAEARLKALVGALKKTGRGWPLHGGQALVGARWSVRVLDAVLAADVPKKTCAWLVAQALDTLDAAAIKFETHGFQRIMHGLFRKGVSEGSYRDIAMVCPHVLGSTCENAISDLDSDYFAFGLRVFPPRDCDVSLISSSCADKRFAAGLLMLLQHYPASRVVAADALSYDFSRHCAQCGDPGHMAQECPLGVPAIDADLLLRDAKMARKALDILMARKASIKQMKETIKGAGLGVADLIERSDVEARYQQALAREGTPSPLDAVVSPLVRNGHWDVLRDVVAAGAALPAVPLCAVVAVLPPREKKLACAFARAAGPDATAYESPELARAFVNLLRKKDPAASFKEVAGGAVVSASTEAPAVVAVRLHKYGMLEALLAAGAVDANAPGPDGDRPIHAALDPKRSPKDMERAVGILLDAGGSLNCNIPGKNKKSAFDLCPPSLLKLLKNAHDAFKKKDKAEKRRREKEKRREKERLAAEAAQATAAAPAPAAAETDATTSAPEPRRAPVVAPAQTPREALLALVASAIEDLTEHGERPDDDLAAVPEDDDDDDRDDDEGARLDGDAALDESDSDASEADAGAVETKEAEAPEDGAFNFEDSLWDVEMGEPVLKWFKKHRDRRPKLVAAIVRRLAQLAAGEWNFRNRKRLEGVSGDLQLFEARLSKGARLLWELAIAFSERRSKAGTIYAQTIRVWSVAVPNHRFDLPATLTRRLQVHRARPRQRKSRDREDLRGDAARPRLSPAPGASTDGRARRPAARHRRDPAAAAVVPARRRRGRVAAAAALRSAGEPRREHVHAAQVLLDDAVDRRRAGGQGRRRRAVQGHGPGVRHHRGVREGEHAPDWSERHGQDDVLRL